MCICTHIHAHGYMRIHGRHPNNAKVLQDAFRSMIQLMRDYDKDKDEKLSVPEVMHMYIYICVCVCVYVYTRQRKRVIIYIYIYVCMYILA